MSRCTGLLLCVRHRSAQSALGGGEQSEKPRIRQEVADHVGAREIGVSIPHRVLRAVVQRPDLAGPHEIALPCAQHPRLIVSLHSWRPTHGPAMRPLRPRAEPRPPEREGARRHRRASACREAGGREDRACRYFTGISRRSGRAAAGFILLRRGASTPAQAPAACEPARGRSG